MLRFSDWGVKHALLLTAIPCSTCHITPRQVGVTLVRYKADAGAVRGSGEGFYIMGRRSMIFDTWEE